MTIIRGSRGQIASNVVRRALVAAAFVWLTAGCVLHRQAARADNSSDTARARELNTRAVAVMVTDPVRADRLLIDAAAADPFYGPAFNNRGVLHLNAGRLYEAAEAFDIAGRLMPGNAEPHVNQAITLERAGRLEDALRSVERAAELDPQSVVSLEAMARLRVRKGLWDARTRQVLGDVQRRTRSEQWRQWATAQLIKLETVQDNALLELSAPASAQPGSTEALPQP